MFNIGDIVIVKSSKRVLWPASYRRKKLRRRLVGKMLEVDFIYDDRGYLTYQLKDGQNLSIELAKSEIKLVYNNPF